MAGIRPHVAERGKAVSDRLIRRLSRGVVVILTCVSALAAADGAWANTGKGYGDSGSSSSSDSGATGDGTSYQVHVKYTHRGTSDGDGAAPVTSSDANFSPPVCWYTSFTPDQFHAEIDRRYDEAGQEGAGTVSDYYNQVQSDMSDIKYHKGDKGSWWVLTWDDNALNEPGATCPYNTGWIWEPPADPPEGAISPQVLAQAAYGQLKLPTKGVELSPKPGNQKVNLPTYVDFKEADAQVSVTAQLTEPNGDTVAATVVAQPYSLHVEAGTRYASPESCDYRLGQSGEGASLDSSGAACNITYTKASAGTYTFTAAMTWRVSWTPTAEVRPDGTPLPDGRSDSDQPVTVEEIQTVNR